MTGKWKSATAEEARRMTEAALVIYVGGEGEEREILPIHIVL
jgi:predicted RNase H-like HicB family nuclease